MKKIIILLVLAMAFVSCHSKGGDHSDHDHASEEKSANKEESHGDDGHDDHEDGEENHEGEHAEGEKEIHLTAEQIKTAKLEIAPVEKKKIRERVSVTGTIEAPPQNKVTVYAPMEAFVYKSDVLLGDKVSKGQTVAVLQHPNFTELQYSYLEAVNKRNVAKADYERKKMLLENDITSKKSFQASEGEYRSLQSLVQNYASQLKMAGISASSVEANGIQQYIYIKAPISGYVVETNLNQGQFLAANSEMMEIIDNDHLHAELNLFGPDITRITKGDDFVFKPSGTDTEYEGYIKLVGQKVDERTKTINVHGHFEDKEKRLKFGMFINAQILLGGKEVFAVPESAIVEIEEEKFVFVAESEDEFIPLEVTTGYTDNGFTEIKTIQNNNFDVKVVTTGSYFLRGKLLQMSGGLDDGHAH